MRTENGIQVFGPDESPTPPVGAPASVAASSRFGFKLVQGGIGLEWKSASEAEFRQAEAQRLGVQVAEVEFVDNCRQTGPMTCNGGFCPGGGGFCVLAYDPAQKLYYCTCSLQ